MLQFLPLIGILKYIICLKTYFVDSERGSGPDGKVIYEKTKDQPRKYTSASDRLVTHIVASGFCPSPPKIFVSFRSNLNNMWN